MIKSSQIKLYGYKESNDEEFWLKPADMDDFEYKLEYCSPYTTGIEENDRVHVDISISDSKNPFVIFIHGFGSRQKKLDNYFGFIELLKEHNKNIAFLNLPFHLHRTPKEENSGMRLIDFGDVETLFFFHQAVVDIKKLINILDIKWNPPHIDIIGMSLGCIVSTLALANEKRLSKGVLLIGGGNWHEIHWKGFLKLILKSNCLEDGMITKKKCFEIYKGFDDFADELKNTDITDIDLDMKNQKDLKGKTTKKCFLCDPNAWGHFIDSSKVMMINSRFDHYFTRKSSTDLWESIGRPEILWLPKLHSSNILRSKEVTDKILDFLAADQ